MLARCYNPHATGYEHWGGRGIRVANAGEVQPDFLIGSRIWGRDQNVFGSNEKTTMATTHLEIVDGPTPKPNGTTNVGKGKQNNGDMDRALY
jgi:hypothetical protein